MQNMKRELIDENNTINQTDLTIHKEHDIQQPLEFTFFLCTCNVLQDKLHRTNLNTSKRVEYDPSGVKAEVNKRKYKNSIMYILHRIFPFLI